MGRNASGSSYSASNNAYMSGRSLTGAQRETLVQSLVNQARSNPNAAFAIEQNAMLSRADRATFIRNVLNDRRRGANLSRADRREILRTMRNRRQRARILNEAFSRIRG